MTPDPSIEHVDASIKRWTEKHGVNKYSHLPIAALLYAAGNLDADGCIFIHNNNKTRTRSLVVQLTKAKKGCGDV